MTLIQISMSLNICWTLLITLFSIFVVYYRILSLAILRTLPKRCGKVKSVIHSLLSMCFSTNLNENVCINPQKPTKYSLREKTIIRFISGDYLLWKELEFRERQRCEKAAAKSL